MYLHLTLIADRARQTSFEFGLSLRQLHQWETSTMKSPSAMMPGKQKHSTTATTMSHWQQQQQQPQQQKQQQQQQQQQPQQKSIEHCKNRTEALRIVSSDFVHVPKPLSTKISSLANTAAWLTLLEYFSHLGSSEFKAFSDTNYILIPVMMSWWNSEIDCSIGLVLPESFQ